MQLFCTRSRSRRPGHSLSSLHGSGGGVNLVQIVEQEMAMGQQLDRNSVVDVLNRLLEAELAGVVRYTHYSFLVFGFTRIPIVSWLREQADESLRHAQLVGEWITSLGAYPSLAIGPLLDSHRHDIAAILKESLDTEAVALGLYRQLLALVEGRSIALEEFARQMIQAEEMHAAEVDKMLRRPGEVQSYGERRAAGAAGG
jgi:bacterioferritin